MGDGTGSLQPPRVGVWGHFHGGNLGDEVVVATVIQAVRRYRPEAELVGFSLGPRDTASRHGIPAWSISKDAIGACVLPPEGTDRVPTRRSPVRGARRRGALRSAGRRFWPLRALARGGRRVLAIPHGYRALRGTELLIVAGSGPIFDDWAGPWEHPYNLFRWAMTARRCDTRFVPLCVGGGPIHQPLSRFFLKRALETAHYRSFRDHGTASLVSSLGVTGDLPVYSDLAFSHPREALEAAARTAPELGNGPPLVGLSTMAHRDPRYVPGADASDYRAFLEKLRTFATWLLDRGYRLLLLRSQVEADQRVAEDLIRRLRERGVVIEGRVLAPPTHGHGDLLGQIARCRFVVGARFHCHVLPFLYGIPVLGLAHHPKTFELMTSMGQDRFCLDIDACTEAEMIAAFLDLRAQEKRVSAEVSARAAGLRAALEAQYARVLGPQPSNRR
jgi:polysaccharide pyruvyl transferase WcaK-like protein